MKKRRIYLDYATTTPLDPQVARAMHASERDGFGNPSSLHREGVVATVALKNARTSVARAIEAHPHEIVFTGSGTEANNLAIVGVIRRLRESGKDIAKLHAVTTTIEHSSVLEPFRALEREGLKVTYVPVDEEGIARLDVLKQSLQKNTVLVSVMYANNEIGTVQPIRKIAALLRSSPARPIFHTDACQAPLYLNVNQDYLGADLISFDAHKLYGPKGVGALYIREGTRLAPILHGGGQERGMRPGTESVPLIVGLAEALALAVKRRARDAERVRRLRGRFLDGILRLIPDVRVNGGMRDRLPNNANISVPGLAAEFAVLQLDARGVACSSKSACRERDEASYVVAALGRADGSESSSLRFTLGRATTARDIDAAVRALAEVVSLQKSGRPVIT